MFATPSHERSRLNADSAGYSAAVVVNRLAGYSEMLGDFPARHSSAEKSADFPLPVGEMKHELGEFPRHSDHVDLADTATIDGGSPQPQRAGLHVKCLGNASAGAANDCGLANHRVMLVERCPRWRAMHFLLLERFYGVCRAEDCAGSVIQNKDICIGRFSGSHHDMVAGG